MHIPPTGAETLETRKLDPKKWDDFKDDVDDFFTDLFAPVCNKFPKTLGCKAQPAPPVSEPAPAPAPGAPVVVPVVPTVPAPTVLVPTPPAQIPTTTTPVANPPPAPTPVNPPPAVVTTPAPIVAPAPAPAPAPQPTQAPGNNNGGGNGGGNGGDNGGGNGGDNGNDNGGGNGNPNPGPGSSPDRGDTTNAGPGPTEAAASVQPQPTATRVNRPPVIGGNNVLLVATGTESGPRPTSFAQSQSDISDLIDEETNSETGPFQETDASGADGLSQEDVNLGLGGSPTSEDGVNSDNGPVMGGGSTKGNGANSNGSGITGGNEDGDGGNSAGNSNNSSGPSALPGILRRVRVENSQLTNYSANDSRESAGAGGVVPVCPTLQIQTYTPCPILPPQVYPLQDRPLRQIRQEAEFHGKQSHVWLPR